jgi:hypothetical protein
MEWGLGIPSPWSLVYQIAVLGILDATLPMAFFAVSLLARGRFTWQTFMRGVSLALPILLLVELSLTLLNVVAPRDANFGPARLSSMLAVCFFLSYLQTRSTHN